MQLSEHKTFKSVDGNLFRTPGKVQICPTIKNVAGTCRLRSTRAHTMSFNDEIAFPGADFAGEIMLETPFLVHSGLDFTDFFANNIDHLFFLIMEFSIANIALLRLVIWVFVSY